MIEIIALFFLTKYIGKLAIQKGEPASTWKIRNVISWIIGEFIGVFIGLAVFGQNLLQISLLALPCAFAGFHITKTLLDRKPDVINQDINQLGDNLLN